MTGAFSSEREMKEVAVDVLPANVRRNSSTRVLTEFEYATGRADIILLDISKAYWKMRVNRLNLTNPIRKKDHLQSFLQLHGRDPITKDYFLEIGAMQERKKSRALDWLTDNGYIVETSDGRIRTAKEFRRHVTTAISVELKLSKWRDALSQAKRASSFTQYQYVAIDENHVARPLENIDRFINANVGLLSLDNDANCTFHYRPERHSPISKLHKWRLNEESLDIIA